MLLLAPFTGDQVVGGDEEEEAEGVPLMVVVVVVVELVNELQQPRGVVGDTELVEVVGEIQAGPLLVDEEELEARCVCPFDCVSCCW